MSERKEPHTPSGPRWRTHACSPLSVYLSPPLSVALSLSLSLSVSLAVSLSLSVSLSISLYLALSLRVAPPGLPGAEDATFEDRSPHSPDEPHERPSRHRAMVPVSGIMSTLKGNTLGTERGKQRPTAQTTANGDTNINPSAVRRPSISQPLRTPRGSFSGRLPRGSFSGPPGSTPGTTQPTFSCPRHRSHTLAILLDPSLPAL